MMRWVASTSMMGFVLWGPASFAQPTDAQGIPTLHALAEGATGFFENRVALVNPGDVPAEITLRYLRQSGPPVERAIVVAPPWWSTTST